MNNKRAQATRINISHFISVISVASILIIWFILSELKLVRPIFLPHPFKVLARYRIEADNLFGNIAITLFRLFIGFLCGSGLGILIGLLMGLKRSINAICEPLIQMIKPIPPLALAPFILLFFGRSLLGIILLVSFGCFFVMVIEVTEAIKNVPKVYRWAAFSLGATQGEVYRKVIFPDMFPSIMGGFRVSIIQGFNLIVLAELYTFAGGIGYLTLLGYRFLRTDLLFAGIFCIIALAGGIDLSFLKLGKWINRWVG